jgi:flagellar hook assembly protein FlgD
MAAGCIGGVLAFGVMLAPSPSIASRANAVEAAPPKAVFIVGPTNGLTDSNLVAAARMADQAAAEGMDVRRVFFPNATWDNVLANIQGASLVVYMGHGYGWPSPYTSRMTESRQNGFGLNSHPGSSRAEHTYYGANPIRANVVLAPNAVVILVHGCYTAGNGEPGMAVPSEELAAQRVDNYAAGFLAVGARAVFAFGWNQRLNYPHALATSDASMDALFMTGGGGSPSGFVGWRDARHASVRSPGAMLHLDPHPSAGYYRSLTGDVGMSAAEWRTGAANAAAPATPRGEPPQITALSAGADASTAGQAATMGVPSFHPNGDGLDDELVVRHNVTRASFLDVAVTSSSGERVRGYSVWSDAGSGISRWNGRDDAGNVVPDGQYRLSYVPRDALGLQGDAASVSATVLTAIALAAPGSASIYPSDGDNLAENVLFLVRLNQPALLTWRIVDESGQLVRSIREDQQTPAGPQSFRWNGRDDAGVWVADGVYRSVVTAQTGLGTYAQERTVFVGAFRITPSSLTVARGARITLDVLSAERLAANPVVAIIEPGVDRRSVTARHLGGRNYRVSVATSMSGTAESVQFLVSGTDVGGGRQSSALILPLE